MNFTHMLSLAWNRNTAVEPAKRDLRALQARIESDLYGRHFYRLPMEVRTRAVFVLENVTSNLHAHALWRLPPGPPEGDHLNRFHAMFPANQGGTWNSIVPSGTYELTVLENISAASNYILKQQHMNSDDRTMFWSDDFRGLRP